MIYNATLNDHQRLYKSCTVYITLLIIIFIIIMGTGSVSMYFYWHTIKILSSQIIINGKILEHDRLDVSKGVKKTSASKEWDICHYWYFLDKSFKYEPCLGQDLIQEAINFNDVSIASIKENYYRIHF